MPTFTYSAMTREGKQVQGTQEASGFDAMRSHLAEQGLEVVDLRLERPVAVAQPPEPTVKERGRIATDVVGPVVGQVPLQHLHFLFRQLATMLNAGINPSQALDTLAGQSTHPKLARILRETRDLVAEGKPITTGFDRYPEVFTPLMLSIIRVGEQGGFLPSALMDLAGYVQRDIELRNMIRRETFYPKLVIFASIVIILAANSVIAALAPGSSGLDSPLTRFGTWLVILPILIGLFLYVRIGLKQPAVKRRHDEVMLRLPFLGGMVRGFAMAKFGRALGALYKAGVPLPDAVRLAADASGNEAMRQRLYPSVGALREGGKVSEVMTAAGVFNPIVLDMARTGEMTGNMDEMLIKTSEFYEDEAQTRAKQSAVVLGAVAFLCVAVYVGYVVVSFWSGVGAGLSRAIGG